jgi:hypothetical protein
MQERRLISIFPFRNVRLSLDPAQHRDVALLTSSAPCFGERCLSLVPAKQTYAETGQHNLPIFSTMSRNMPWNRDLLSLNLGGLCKVADNQSSSKCDSKGPGRIYSNAYYTSVAEILYL